MKIEHKLEIAWLYLQGLFFDILAVILVKDAVWYIDRKQTLETLSKLISVYKIVYAVKVMKKLTTRELEAVVLSLKRSIELFEEKLKKH